MLQISKVGSEGTFINMFGDCIKDSTFIKESHIVPDSFQHIKHGSDLLIPPTAPFERLMSNNYGKVTSSQIFTPRLERSIHEPFDRSRDPLNHRKSLNREPATYRSNIFADERVGARPSSSFSVPKHPLSDDVKDELKKSQMRVSMLKSKEDLKNRRVSTAEIFNS